ncbi:MAG: DUF4124 domain-containing protein [Azoarcus sp.]|jgi:hypothetical protein|nr:DUF4124 domain-containing protein [Azoarcus sp.]
MTIRHAIPLFFLALGLAPFAASSAEVYKCIGADGNTTYTNSRNDAQSCETVNATDKVTVVSTPRIRPAASSRGDARPRPAATTTRDSGERS